VVADFPSCITKQGRAVSADIVQSHCGGVSLSPRQGNSIVLTVRRSWRGRASRGGKSIVVSVVWSCLERIWFLLVTFILTRESQLLKACVAGRS